MQKLGNKPIEESNRFMLSFPDGYSIIVKRLAQMTWVLEFPDGLVCRFQTTVSRKLEKLRNRFFDNNLCGA